ncbi:hypothetical protein ACJJTC_012780 [Scirpophaga incertulas]
MSMNYAFGFSLFLLILVGLNVYFFYTMNTVDIYNHLNYLPSSYRHKISKFSLIQKNLLQSFNISNVNNVKYTLHNYINWPREESLFPYRNGISGQMLVKHKLYFKPKRYKLDTIINGNIYAGFDRHNSEVFAYYLAMIMNFTWIAPSVIRKLHLQRDVLPVATVGLKKAMVKNENGSMCIYGKCFYCKINETVLS